MSGSRTKNSLYNLASSVAGQAAIFLFSFISRMVFVRCLSREYLGLSGVFDNVLTVLSLVELGIGPAMTFALYKPLADGNVQYLKSLMQLYRRSYVLIGIAILCLGLGFTPFYRFLIQTDADIAYLDVIYLLYVFNTAISYFYSYKRSLLEADQKKYWYNITHALCKVALDIAQIAALLITKDYLAYLVIQILFTWIENIVIARIADRRYPFLLEKNIQPLTKAQTAPIWRNVKAVVFHKVGSIVVNSTDNLILSKFIGLAVVGVYSNYLLVINGIHTVIDLFFGSVTASVGNLNVSSDQRSINLIFNRLFFLQNWLYGWASIGLICLIQPVITIFFGKRYLFDMEIVVWLGLVFYTNGMRRTILIYKDTAGLYYKDWFKPILEAVFNLFASIYLLKVIGVSGVFIATVITNLGIASWIESYVVYKNVLKTPYVKYFIQYGTYTVLNLLAGLLTYMCCQALPLTGFLLLIGKLLLAVLIPNALNVLFYHRTEMFRYYRGIAVGLASRLLQHGGHPGGN